MTTLVASQRELTAKLVACLGEIEERRLHLVAGFSSMFEYCVLSLGMSEGEAFRRILAARLGKQFPVIHSLLGSGAVNLSTLELLRGHLTEENHVELLAAASNKGKREIQSLLALRFPLGDTPSRIRAARMSPLSEHRFHVEFTADADLAKKLELCRDLMGHSNPSGDLAIVVGRAVELLLAERQSKRRAILRQTAPTPSAAAAAPPAKGVSRRIRRQVFERDGERCAYVSADGRRCTSRRFLELDHIQARALGGSHHPDNLRVLCRAHNQLHAEQTFGRVHVDRHRYFCRQKCPAPAPAWDRALEALKNLGFRSEQARRAVVLSRDKHGDVTTVESALRHALRELLDEAPAEPGAPRPALVA